MTRVAMNHIQESVDGYKIPLTALTIVIMANMIVLCHYNLFLHFVSDVDYLESVSPVGPINSYSLMFGYTSFFLFFENHPT